MDSGYVDILFICHQYYFGCSYQPLTQLALKKLLKLKNTEYRIKKFTVFDDTKITFKLSQIKQLQNTDVRAMIQDKSKGLETQS